MQPNQNQYDFITDPVVRKKKSLLPSGGFNMSKKMMIVLGVTGFLIVATLIALVYSQLTGGPTNADQLIVVAQQQNELIRISEVAIKEATGTQAKNLAMTTKLSLRSDQTSLLAALKAQKVKVGALKTADPETDKMLTEATQNNRFDEVYLEHIQKELVDYQKKLETAYKTTEGTKLKATMKTQYENASIIIGVDPEV